MEFLGIKPETNMAIFSLKVGQKLPDKIMVIVNDTAKVYDMRDQ